MQASHILKKVSAIGINYPSRTFCDALGQTQPPAPPHCRAAGGGKHTQWVAWAGGEASRNVSQGPIPPSLSVPSKGAEEHILHFTCRSPGAGEGAWQES